MQDKDKIREGHIENWLNIETPVIKILLLPEIIALEASGRGDKPCQREEEQKFHNQRIGASSALETL